MTIVVYILSSIVLGCIGIILMIWQPTNFVSSIGLSFLASGLSSIAFTLIKYCDDKSSKESLKNIETKIDNIDDNVNFVTTNRIIVDDPDSRCIYRQHVTKEFTEAIAKYSDSPELYVDVMGLSLSKFAQEQLPNLLRYKNIHLRIIVQNPGAEATKHLAKMEGRDYAFLCSEINKTTREVLHMKDQNPDVSINIKWFNEYPSITFDRINDVLFVRPRMLRETSGNLIFYERYYNTQDYCWKTYTDYFSTAWSIGSEVELVGNAKIVTKQK